MEKRKPRWRANKYSSRVVRLAFPRKRGSVRGVVKLKWEVVDEEGWFSRLGWQEVISESVGLG
jgi:hypothetical protein